MQSFGRTIDKLLLQKVLDLKYKPRNPPAPRRKQHGSTAIGVKSSRSLYYAFEHAKRIGTPMGTMATIAFGATLCDPAEAVQAFKRLRNNYFSKWARRHGFEPTWVFVFENARYGMSFTSAGPLDDHNLHVHFAVYVPDYLATEFEGNLRRWIDKVTGGIVDQNRVLHIGHCDNAATRNYLLKGSCNPQWAQLRNKPAQPQGLVVGGNRSGTSRNLFNSRRVAMDRQIGIKRPLPKPRVIFRDRDAPALD